MAIRQIQSLGALRQVQQIQLLDPFQLAAPSWLVRVLPQLPPVKPVSTVTLEYIKEKERMPIKTVPIQQAPDRFFKRGVISGKKDYADVLKWLGDAKPGDAAVLDMDPEQWKEKDEKTGAMVPMKKPETKLAFTLRRLFESKKMAITAYQSGHMQITIRKSTEADKLRYGGRKKKGK